MQLRVGVVDSGWDARLPDRRVASGLTVKVSKSGRVGFEPDTTDLIGHGTHVSKIILEIAPFVSIVPIKVFRERLVTQTKVLIAALAWAVENEIPLVNLSLGTACMSDAAELFKVCDFAERHGTIIVAAARGDTLALPAHLAPVIGVRSAEALNYGQIVFRDGEPIECYAKGVRLKDLNSEGIDRLIAAGSYAAPEVTGRVAKYLAAGGIRRIENVRCFLRQEALLDLYRFKQM